MKIVQLEDNIKAYAEVKGVRRLVYIELLPHLKAGDYVIVHAGFAIEIIDEDEALERISLFEELLALGDEL